MRQTSSVISTYSADVFGVCSALFELGGMVVMHDASGCNSTYTTHDEPRWYDMESMVYISGLSEMEAIMGDDEKLILDIITAANELKPKFIALAGTPIPMMTGFDYTAAANIIEARLGIPALGFSTGGMGTYISGASMAFDGIVRRFMDKSIKKSEHRSVNILGLTPLDFSVNGEDKSIAAFLESSGFSLNCSLAMGCDIDDIKNIGAAHVNLVVSSAGLLSAKTLFENFGTPYVIGTPTGKKYSDQLRRALDKAVSSCENIVCKNDEALGGDIVVIGEGVRSLSLASAIELETGKGAKVACATEFDPSLLREKDAVLHDEDYILDFIKDASVVIADPLYRRIVPEGAKFIPLPHEAFSGRIYRRSIPDLAKDAQTIISEV